jgi:hypothetical protein
MAAPFAACSAPLLGYQNFTEVKPSPQQVAWQDLEFGAHEAHIREFQVYSDAPANK